MKNYLKTGLLALTIALGVVACDKDAVNDTDLLSVASQETSKVTFGEEGNGIKVEGKNVAGKSASEFTHKYSSTPQVLSIVNAAGVEVYTGSYTANNISTINPSDIILANANGYVASSSNASNISDDVVLSFLPYTSTIGFDLSASASIQLEASLLRGFLIVNVEDATDNVRVQSAKIVVGDGTKISLNGPDAEGDYWGYLNQGIANIEVTYLLDGNEVVITGSEEVRIGSAYTIDLMLVADQPAVTTRTATSTENGVEADLTHRADGGDINGDGDILDTYTREVSTLFTTTGGVEDDGVPTNGAWVIDVDNSPVVVTEDGTDTTTDAEAAAAQAEIDRLAQVEADRLAEVARLAAIAAQEAADAAAQAEVDRLAAIATEEARVEAERVAAAAALAAEQAAAAALLAAAPDTYTYSDWSGTAPAAQTENGAWSPLTAESSVATISQSRSAVSVTASYDETRTATIQVNGDVDSPVPATASLTRSVPETRSPLADETRDIANPAFIPPSTDNGAGDVAATGTLTVTEVRATLGGFGNTYTISSANGATVTAGDDVVITWGGTAAGTVHTISITEDDLSDDAVVITVDRDFVTSTKS